MLLCSIQDCTAPALSRGWCSKHYQRWYQHGDPLAMAVRKPPGPRTPPTPVDIERERARRRESKRRSRAKASPETKAREREYKREWARARAHEQRHIGPIHGPPRPPRPKQSPEERAAKHRESARRSYHEKPENKIRQLEYQARHRDYRRRQAIAYREDLKQIPCPKAGFGWTPDEDIIVMREDITLKEMCYILNRSYKSISQRRHKLLHNSGAQPPGGRRRPQKRVDDGARLIMRKQRESGLTLTEVANNTGWSATTVRLATADITPITRKSRVRQPLNENERVDILQLRSNGLTLNEISIATGRSIKAVWKVTQNYELQ